MQEYRQKREGEEAMQTEQMEKKKNKNEAHVREKTLDQEQSDE